MRSTVALSPFARAGSCSLKAFPRRWWFKERVISPNCREQGIALKTPVAGSMSVMGMLQQLSNKSCAQSSLSSLAFVANCRN